ncbi:MAG: hypothetical protein RLZZ533_1068 [Cyanobacteriota bacterium]|jgi:hypothetical protein
MAGSGGGRKGSGRASGGSSVAAGRKAKARYQMQQANKRFKSSPLPQSYAPKYTKNGR